MKKNNIIYLLVIALVTFSCEDYLDVNPEMGVDAKQVYSDYYNFRSAVDRANWLLHNYVYDKQDWDTEIGAYSDEAQSTMLDKPSTDINKGLWMNFNGRDFGFKNCSEFNSRQYYREPAAEGVNAIRAINECFANWDLLTEFPKETEYSEQELKYQLRGQMFLLRAWHYFQIINRYGGMPEMRDVSSTDAIFDVERPTYVESAKWILEDLDSAMLYLPEKWNAQNKGRATLTTAKAIKEMVLLYMASPNMNGLNPYGSDTKKYDIELCKQAASAAIEAINSVNNPNTRYRLLSKDEYTDNWYNKDTGIPDEAIWQPPMSTVGSPCVNQGVGLGWFLPTWDGGWAVFLCPTQNAVEWFQTKDGYDVDDPAAASHDFDPLHPYDNRDPRLKINIFCPGDNMYISASAKYRYLESYPGGYHYETMKKKNLVWTGYAFAGKHRWPGLNPVDKEDGYYRIFPFIRVAQLYLDFAEAANEAYGPQGSVPGTDLTAVDAINIVRNRIGMPDVISEYSANKEVFRQHIYQERAVELYQEFHRWEDIRRWRIAKDLFADSENCIKGVSVTKKSDGNFEYKSVSLGGVVRVFEDQMYWYPFDTSTMNMMLKFKQNPGW